jgi:hypothetical protein
VKLIVEINLDGAEFHRDGDPDTDPSVADGDAVAEILKRIAARVRGDDLEEGHCVRIKSINGHTIGSWMVQGD